MGNLLGEGFPEQIIKQVEERQKAYGAGYADGTTRSLDQLKYLNTNTSWCKLVSSVDVSNQSIITHKSLSKLTGIGDSELARKFVLFNGVQEGNTLREGIDFGNNILSENAYGIGGNEFGSRPMMGIKSANIKHLNKGSIRTATVQVKAWNKIQFDIIDALYLRLGFNILLEWGHVSYFDNKGEYQENVDNSLAESFLTGTDGGKNLNYSSFLQLIEKQRIKTFGNYDAMFAKVSNMHWSFLKDGSYDITLDLTSVGDVIESFKMNALNPSNIVPLNTTPTTTITVPPPSFNQQIKLASNQSTINQYFNQMLEKLTVPLQLKTIIITPSKSNPLGGQGIGNYAIGVIDFKFNDLPSSASPSPAAQGIKAFAIPAGSRDGFEISPPTGVHQQFYCRLGNFLEFIQNHVLYQVGSQSDLFPLMKIDTKVESNLIYLNPLQVSMDPTVCVVNRTLKIDDRRNPTLLAGVNFNSFIDSFTSPITSPSKSEYGQIMNIYVNVKFIMTKMDELKDEKGRLPLIDFLKGILAGINGALGGINELDVFIDEITNTIKIIDKNPIPDIQFLMEHINSLDIDAKLNTKYAEFELYGYNTVDNTAGFIKDFNFKTELSPAMSTMITVGATANGTVVGENATALSRLNNGYTDRFKPFITDNTSNLSPLSALPQLTNLQGFKIGNLWEGVGTGRSLSTPPPLPNAAKDTFVKIHSEYFKFYNNFIDYLIKLSNWNFTSEEISTYKDALVNYNNAYAVYKKAREDYELTLPKGTILASSITKYTMQPSTGFIPFNLSLTMNGLSGMKINSKFLIDTSYLPSNYPDTVDFLIKNLSHKIENNKWDTMLESYCISKGEYEESTQIINPQGQQSQGQQSQGGTPNPFPSFTTSTVPSTVGINPEDVIIFTSNSGNRQHYNSLKVEFRNRFLQLAFAYKNKTGKKVTLNSAVRTQSEQTALWTAWVNGGGNYPGRPGYDASKPIVAKVNGINIPLQTVGRGHGTGTAVDVDDADGLEALPEFKTLGFNRVIPKSDDLPHIEIKSLGGLGIIITMLSMDTTTTPWN
jgi:hypothetical protein